MKIIEHNLEKRVQFWSLLGPFFILLIFFVSLVKVSHTNLILAMISLIAIPICWRWKVYGLAAVIGTLAAVVAYHFNDLTLIDKLWEVGMGIAISIACTVTTLSFEEAENLVQNLKVQSDSRLTNIWHLDEKLKTLQETYQSEKKLLVEELEQAKLKISKYRTDLEEAEKLSQAAQQEILVSQKKRNELLEELFSTRNELAREKLNQDKIKQLQVSLDDYQMKMVRSEDVESENTALKEEIKVLTATHDLSLLDADAKLRQSEGKYRQLTRQFKEKSEVLNETRKELFLAQESYTALAREMEEIRVYGVDDEHEELIKHLTCIEKEYADRCRTYQDEIDELNALILHIFQKQKDERGVSTPAPKRRIMPRK